MAQFFPDLSQQQAPAPVQTESGVSDIGSINTPPEENFNTEAMQGSMQQFLADNLGEYVIIEFLIGTQTMARKQGILHSVGRSVLTLFEETTQTYVLCDIFSVKFVTFYHPNQRPGGQITYDVTTGKVIPSTLGTGRSVFMLNSVPSGASGAPGYGYGYGYRP